MAKVNENERRFSNSPTSVRSVGSQLGGFKNDSKQGQTFSGEKKANNYEKLNELQKARSKKGEFETKKKTTAESIDHTRGADSDTNPKSRYNNLQKERLEDSKFNKRTAMEESPEKEGGEQGVEDARIMAARGIHDAATGSKAAIPMKVAKLGTELRRGMKSLNSAAIQVAYALAIMMDFSDMIPMASFIFTWILGPLLFMMLWGYGNWKVKLVRAILIALDIIPGIGLLPLNIICVMHAVSVIKKKIEKDKKKLHKLQKQHA